MMGDDKLRDFIRRANHDRQNGIGPGPSGMPPHFQPRPSGWRCPKCGLPAQQRADPAPGTVTGYHWMTIGESTGFQMPDDDRPSPISVVVPEIIERDERGVPTQTYTTIHCFNCFNLFQQRKMMEEIRANVPQLEWHPEEAP